MLWRPKPAAVGFIEPCQPHRTAKPPAGNGWLHEIKHDGYRMMARRDGGGVRLLTRNGHDWSNRYPLIVAAANALKCQSCLIDGEAVVCDAAGLAVFQKLRGRKDDARVFLYAFDLIEIDGQDLRKLPIEDRKFRLLRLLRKSQPGLRYSEHLQSEGALVFHHACKLGCEGIVSKRKGSRYRSGRTKYYGLTLGDLRRARAAMAKADRAAHSSTVGGEK